jgi:hypothetical protein
MKPARDVTTDSGTANAVGRYIFVGSGQSLLKAIDNTMPFLDEWDTTLPALAGAVAALVARGAINQSAVALKLLHRIANDLMARDHVDRLGCLRNVCVAEAG